jgi:Tol biopolymer transport system component
MRNRLFTAAVALCAGISAAALRAVPTATDTLAKTAAAADDAWERGDYVNALNDYIRVLTAPGAQAHLESIALKTGELFETRELTADGRAPRFSPDDSYIAYETGLEVSRRTRVVRNDASHTEVLDLPGVAATFSSTTPEVAYLKIPDHADIRRASEALEKASLTASNRAQLIQELTWLIAKHATIVVRDLNNGREMELPAPELVKTGLVFSADGRSLFFLGADDADAERRTDVYTISEREPRASLVVDTPGLKSAPMIDASGATMIYVVPVQSPLRRPQGRQDGVEGQGGQEGRQGQAAPRVPTAFAIVDLARKKATMIEGTAPTLSADGRTIAYIQQSAGDFRVMRGPTRGAHTVIKQTVDRLDAPALSADGSRIAFQEMLRDDWELFVADGDGKNNRRVTRDIEHDVLPRFVGPDRLLGVIGEPRHRRSFLYDLTSMTRTRLFHNNTVRTIAPEYQWAISADCGKLLIGADRDGDTVSPQRGVYLVDLQHKVTRTELLARLRENLKSEVALKEFGARAFQPIAADVKPIVERVSTNRIYEFEKALFDFDSKHITRPGNQKAGEFLFNTYRSFGYQPEYQWFEPRGALGGKTANIVATLRGTVNPELVYVVSSHYDSVAVGPGADDDTSGTAALLEAARVLAHHPMPATIVFASFTGEESGLLGSREFVRRALENKTKIAAALNNDMVGWTNDARLDNTIRYSNPGIRDIQHGAAMLFSRLITFDSRYFKGTDAASYYDAYGDIVGGIGSYPVLSSPHYHQPSDLLEYENHQLIAETSKTTVATLMLLASSPARIKNVKVRRAGTAATLTWTPSPEAGVASYIVAYGPPSNPLLHRVSVPTPHATLAAVEPGTTVAVKAVNARGMAGWDWAYGEIE